MTPLHVVTQMTHRAAWVLHLLASSLYSAFAASALLPPFPLDILHSSLLVLGPLLYLVSLPHSDLVTI